jgi:hypothetical protein
MGQSVQLAVEEIGKGKGNEGKVEQRGTTIFGVG